MAEISPREAIMQLIDLAKLVAEDAGVIAETKRKLFDAYVKEGFTQDQALQLIKPNGGLF